MVNDIKVDKDAVLFSDILDFELLPHYHSPVVLARNTSREYLEDPAAFDFRPSVVAAAKYLNQRHDIVVYEGTGHPGVGTVVDLSNADVAKLLNAGVVMIVEGGIGNTIDRLNMSLALFRESGVPILGVIVNKVRPDKMDMVEHFLKIKLKKLNIPILGMLPYDQTLSFPIIETIIRAVDGKVLLNSHKLYNRVEDIVAGSLVDAEEFSTFKNILLVVSIKRLEEAVAKIQRITELKKLDKPPLSGVLVTGDGRHARWYSEKELQNPYFREHDIPVITTELDTYGSVVKISRIEVKINTRTPWKAKRAIELIKQRVNFELMLDRAHHLA